MVAGPPLSSPGEGGAAGADHEERKKIWGGRGNAVDYLYVNGTMMAFGLMRSMTVIHNAGH